MMDPTGEQAWRKWNKTSHSQVTPGKPGYPAPSAISSGAWNWLARLARLAGARKPETASLHPDRPESGDDAHTLHGCARIRGSRHTALLDAGARVGTAAFPTRGNRMKPFNKPASARLGRRK